ncbi:hypothetical protein [Glutamicibacter sp.]|uniref:hypothetical protein n=1 Tax=Glutamicibacter sp. TaxID=1931995 RepID=UPI002B4842B8|nr:hypothetical protein [Glutamicibacter sp.]HJX78083.1 hypothetical protein [Glutamicibacter sp.]
MIQFISNISQGLAVVATLVGLAVAFTQINASSRGRKRAEHWRTQLDSGLSENNEITARALHKTALGKLAAIEQVPVNSIAIHFVVLGFYIYLSVNVGIELAEYTVGKSTTAEVFAQITSKQYLYFVALCFAPWYQIRAMWALYDSRKRIAQALILDLPTIDITPDSSPAKEDKWPVWIAVIYAAGTAMSGTFVGFTYYSFKLRDNINEEVASSLLNLMPLPMAVLIGIAHMSFFYALEHLRGNTLKSPPSQQTSV